MYSESGVADPQRLVKVRLHQTNFSDRRMISQDFHFLKKIFYDDCRTSSEKLLLLISDLL